MNRARLIAVAGAAALFTAACERTEPTSPSANIPTVSFAKTGASCAIDIGTTVSPLPALHGLEEWINESLDAAGSSVNCGQTRSLDAKMEQSAQPGWRPLTTARGGWANPDSQTIRSLNFPHTKRDRRSHVIPVFPG